MAAELATQSGVFAFRNAELAYEPAALAVSLANWSEAAPPAAVACVVPSGKIIPLVPDMNKFPEKTVFAEMRLIFPVPFEETLILTLVSVPCADNVGPLPVVLPDTCKQFTPPVGAVMNKPLAELAVKAKEPWLRGKYNPIPLAPWSFITGEVFEPLVKSILPVVPDKLNPGAVNPLVNVQPPPNVLLKEESPR